MGIRPIDADALVKEVEEYQKSMIFHSHSERMHFDDMIDFCVDHLEEAPSLSLNTLRDAIYQDAVAHGLWDDMDGLIAAQTHVVVSEVRELLDAAVDLSEAIYRGYDIAKYKQHYAEELADVVISSMSLAGKREIDIDAEVRRKMEINKGRPWRHEGEK